MFRPQSRRTPERPIVDRVAVKRPLVELAGALRLVRVVVRGGVELPTFRFSGRTYPQLVRIVRVLCAVAGCRCLPLVAAVAVTVAVSTARADRE